MNLKTPRRVALVGAVAIAMVVAIGGIAVGTSGSGVTNSTFLARGTAEDKIKTRGNQASDVVAHSITIAPGGHTGWHSHPGQAIVIIKSGTFTTYDANDKNCTPHVYEQGQVYVDRGYGHSHIARNEGSVPLELHVTYLDVPVGVQPVNLAVRNDTTPSPGNCPF